MSDCVVRRYVRLINAAMAIGDNDLALELSIDLHEYRKLFRFR